MSPAMQSELRQVEAMILGRAPEHDIDPTTDRVAQALDLLGDPHRAYQCVHVTGTNGKTSTARMIDELVREHGLRTGRFTSPHLSSITERISIDGQPVTAEHFVATWRDIEPYIQMVDDASTAGGGPRMSFFEVLTVMAFAAFADAPVDVAIIEVGMGGQWDATNLIDAQVSVITPIAVDHERWLGREITQIATEKAGIIAAGAQVIVAEQPAEAAAVIQDRAEQVGAHVIADGVELAVVDRRVAVGGQLLDLRTAGALYTEVFVPLHGAHQAHNAVLALAATEAVIAGGGALSGEIVEAGFAHVTSPGRLEVVRSSPLILVDAAHNPAGASALTDALAESFELRHLVGVVAIMADKDAEGILSALEPTFAHLVVTSNMSPRCYPVADLADIASDIFGDDRVSVAERLDDAIQQAVDLAERQDTVGVGTGVGVVVTGSVVTVAHARTLLGRDGTLSE